MNKRLEKLIIQTAKELSLKCKPIKNRVDHLDNGYMISLLALKKWSRNSKLWEREALKVYPPAAILCPPPWPEKAFPREEQAKERFNPLSTRDESVREENLIRLFVSSLNKKKIGFDLEKYLWKSSPTMCIGPLEINAYE